MTYMNYPTINLGTVLKPTNETVANYFNLTGERFDNDTFDNRLKDSYFPYRYGSFFVIEANNKTK